MSNQLPLEDLRKMATIVRRNTRKSEHINKQARTILARLSRLVGVAVATSTIIYFTVAPTIRSYVPPEDPVAAELVQKLGKGNYEFVRSRLNDFLGTDDFLPSYHRIMKVLEPAKEIIEKTTFELSEDSIKYLTNLYYSEHCEKGKRIPGVLAVDAVSFTRYVSISKEGYVNGVTIDEMHVKKEDLKTFRSNTKKFEAFLMSIEDKTIKNAFVYLFQPLDPNIECQVLHITKSHTGKATEDTVKTLKTICDFTQNTNIEIIGLGFDGDSGYNSLNEEMFETIKANYIRAKFENRGIFNVNFNEVIFMDPLHLLKRGRYRFLSNKCHSWCTMSSEVISLQKVANLDVLSSYALDNSKITKMNDKFPVELFGPLTIEALNDYDDRLSPTRAHPEISYMLPFTLYSMAISDPDLSINDRLNLLEVVIHFSMMYIEDMEIASHDPNERVPQKRGKNIVNVAAYSMGLIRDLVNSATAIGATIVKVLDKHFQIGALTLNSLGSNPLEHTFGCMRFRARDKRYFDESINAMITNEFLKMYKYDKFGSVRGRIGSFGVHIDFRSQLEDRFPNFPNPKEMVVSIYEYLRNGGRDDNVKYLFEIIIHPKAKKISEKKKRRNPTSAKCSPGMSGVVIQSTTSDWSFTKFKPFSRKERMKLLDCLSNDYHGGDNIDWDKLKNEFPERSMEMISLEVSKIKEGKGDLVRKKRKVCPKEKNQKKEEGIKMKIEKKGENGRRAKKKEE